MTHQHIQDLLSYLDSSPTAWHAVAQAKSILEKNGFTQLHEQDAWSLAPGSRYYVVRNGSSLCAFILPKAKIDQVHLVLSHTDSPGFKLKPNAEYKKDNMIMLGVEIYGSPLITSWLNRDLGIAGRVYFLDSKGDVTEKLVTLQEAVTIPQLALHLDRQVNDEGLVLNKQDHLAALAGVSSSEKSFLEESFKRSFKYKEILSSDLFLYPLEKASLIGLKKELIASYRIDNLCSVYASLLAINSSKPAKNAIRVIAAMDNEEIGSATPQGIDSPFFSHLLERILMSTKLSREDYLRLAHNSICISVDMAHATHPNYPDRHEPRHPITMGNGVVIKYNAQNRYASNAHSASHIIALLKSKGLKYQQFVTRGNIPCGTTVGPLHAHNTGMPTVDIGIPQLSMHSCREVAACKDMLDLITLLEAVLSS